MTRPLLILRPEPDAQATAARASAMGLVPMIRPLFDGVAMPWTPPVGAFDAVMMTSANAARYGGPGLAAYHGHRLFTVGGATAAAAAAAGFADIDAGSNDVNALLLHIGATMPGRILYFAARDQAAHADPLFEIVTVVVYAMETLPAPPLPSDAVALVHSARAGARLAEIVTDRDTIDLVAISASAGAAAGSGWRSVRWPEMPGDAAMLALAAPLCES